MIVTPFEYYEIRPCVDFGWHVESFLGEPTAEGFHTPEAARLEAEAAAAAEAAGRSVFWTLYGVRAGNTTAIGDFGSFAYAYEVMQAILMPLRTAADTGDTTPLEDICNQSSTEERL